MEKIVFTNGCFDIIHPGHIDLLERARALGTKLVVAINSDRSVRAIKGAKRPLMNENDRRTVLKSIKWVDEVLIFDELTPEKIIKELKPDVLVKGGDWLPDQIIGADFVMSNGGEVYSLPLLGDYSSSKIIDTEFLPKDEPLDENLFTKSIREHIGVFETLLRDDLENIGRIGELLFQTLSKGRKIMLCGNGGSAADAQHIAAELVGRFEEERRAWPAIALTTDTSALTALANDYGFEKVFARQVQALANDGDVLIAISTSGVSESIIKAVMEARRLNCLIIGLTGQTGKKLASLSDEAFMVPSARTARIQEAHIAVGHLWCEYIDYRSKNLFPKSE